MFGLFKKKSPVEKLNKKYQDLMSEAHRLSTTNRQASDAKFAEAQEVLGQIENIQKEG